MRREVGHLLDAAEELPAVHVGQHDVERDERQRLLHRERERGLGGGGVQHREALGLELHADQLGGLVVVFDDQRGARAREPPRCERGRRLGRRRDRRFRRRAERQPDREAGALARRRSPPPPRRRAARRAASPSPGPRPVPSNFRARPLSIWLNGWNSCRSPSRRDADAAVGDADLEELRELVVGQREAPARPARRTAGRRRRAGRGRRAASPRRLRW